MLYKPHHRFYRVTEITPEFLNKNGIKGLLLDVDNTLSTHKGQELVDNLPKWIETMKAGGIRLTIISNAAKERLVPFAAKIGLQFVHRAAKPLFWGYVLGAKRLGLKIKETAIVGDQLFTDIMGANLIGMPNILVEPILLETGKSFIVRRRWEKKILGKERGEI